MVTVLAVAANTTRAVAAGPRATLSAWKPCCGLQDTSKAPAVAHRATTVPPDEVSTVPLVALVPPVPPVLLVPPWDRDRGEDDGSTWLACAWLSTGAAECCWPGDAAMPSPSSDTTSRLPAVAATAPRSHAPVAIRVRVRMLPRVADATLSAGKARLKGIGACPSAITGFCTRNGGPR